MPRRPRRMSESGYMHVIVRGVGKQILFEDSMDFKHFLKRLEQYSLETEVKICAYCLMENHVHLLVHGESNSLALLMKKIGVSYSGYYNKKYDRVGHLFQDRYLSEPVETENYLMTVFRYILKNPQKAGICHAAEYRWSSYGLYDNPPEFMDLTLIKALIGDCKQYSEFVNIGTEDQCLEFDTKRDDEWAEKELKACLKISSGTKLKAYSIEDRNASLVKLKRHGLTVRQIERLTGINRNIIQKAGK
ncbi:transposase [Butyrivibrio sp. VCB2001]|uniref:transposase n=1 Tax=Butyrivibrio sp. VCB2001 TaxID=1280667 RepID=UPI00040321F7|nr:transposase [Butyrivibrio sp. VCB2001]